MSAHTPIFKEKAKDSTCPFCGGKFESIAGNCKPAPGLWTLCFYCVEFLVFDRHLVPQKPTAKDLRELDAQPDKKEFLLHTQQHFRQFKAEQN